MYDLLPPKPPKEDTEDHVMIPVCCDNDNLNKASFDGRNSRDYLFYKIEKADCTDHHLAKAQEKASGRTQGIKTVKRVGKYSAFKKFGPAPKFGHFWRFSEYFSAKKFGMVKTILPARSSGFFYWEILKMLIILRISKNDQISEGPDQTF